MIGISITYKNAKGIPVIIEKEDNLIDSIRASILNLNGEQLCEVAQALYGGVWHPHKFSGIFDQWLYEIIPTEDYTGEFGTGQETWQENITDIEKEYTRLFPARISR